MKRISNSHSSQLQREPAAASGMGIGRTSLAEMANRSPQAIAQRALVENIDNSASMMAQRKRLQGFHEGATQLQDRPEESTIPKKGSMTFQMMENSTGPVQLMTDVKSGPTTTLVDPTNGSNTMEAGTSMVATLDPADIQTGSRVDPELSGPLQEETAGSKRRYVQGHLLNSRVGGSGSDAANLTPLTYSANSTHFHSVEKEILKAAKTQMVKYTVIPDYSATPHASSGEVSGIERAFAGKLSCSWDIGGTKGSTPIHNVPPFPSA